MDISGNFTEDEIYNMMKDLPDFLNFPFPTHWYEKYNIKLLRPKNSKEALEEDHAYKCMYAQKDLPPIFIKEPEKSKYPEVKIPEPDTLILEEKPFNPNDTKLEGLIVS